MPFPIADFFTYFKISNFETEQGYLNNGALHYLLLLQEVQNTGFNVY